MFLSADGLCVHSATLPFIGSGLSSEISKLPASLARWWQQDFSLYVLSLWCLVDSVEMCKGGSAVVIGFLNYILHLEND